MIFQYQHWHELCNHKIKMIESALFTPAQPDNASFSNWQGAVKRAVMRLDPEARTAGPIPSFGRMIQQNDILPETNAPLKTAQLAPAETPAIESGSDDYQFSDMIDVINPLQHLPVIGTFYRKWTGDTMKPMSSILGGALFGGPIGAIASTANVVTKSQTGKDIAENALSFAGFSTDAPARPNIVYGQNNGTNDLGKLDGTTLALANLSAAGDGHKNFARSNYIESWNS